jgi:hypothetical protein
MYSSTLSLSSALDGGEWTTQPLVTLAPVKETRYPLCKRLGGAPGTVWTGAENPIPTRIRSSERPALSESQYGLSYRGPLHKWEGIKMCMKWIRVAECSVRWLALVIGAINVQIPQEA